MRLRSGAEHARDRPRLRHHLHPQRARAVRARRPLVVRELRRQPTTAAAPTRSGATAADADLFINLSGGSWFWRDEYARIPRKVFIDSDPAFTQLAIAKAEPWYVEFFERFDHLFTFGANIGTPRLADSDRRLHLAQDLAADHDRRLAHERAARRPLHDGDDLADRKLHRRRRQQGPGVREVHRAAVADPAALRARDQRTAAAAARSTAGRRWMPCRSRARRRPTATSSRARRPSSASPSTPTSRTARAGSAIGRSAIWRRAARRSCRTPAGPRICRPATGLLAFTNLDEALAGVDRINTDYDAPRATSPDEIARDALRRRQRC